MKFVCEKNKLLGIIGVVQKAVPAKSTVSAMECIKIDAKTDGSVAFTGANLELYIEYKSVCEVNEGGSAALESKVFGEIIRRMPEGDVSVRVNEENNVVKISSGQSELSVSSRDVREYPEKPSAEGNIAFSVEQAKLRDVIRQVIFAAAVNNPRPVLNGVLFDIKNSRLRAVALDNSRLALREVEVGTDAVCSFIIPQVTLREILKLLKDDDSTVEISVSDKHALFDFGEFTVITRLINGEFINYSAIVSNARNTISVELETKILCESLERASLLINDDSANRQNLPVRLFFKNGGLEVNCMTSKGMIHDIVPIQLSGEDIEIGFNYKLMLEALRATEEERVKIEMSNPLASCFLKPTDDEKEYIYIVQPVRL